MSINLEDDPSNDRILMRFTLPRDAHDGPVSVVGSFNDWTPGTDLLIDHGDGYIGVNIPVAPGSEIRFRYLGSKGRWFDDPDADAITDQGGIVHIPVTAADAAVEDPSSGGERPVAAPAGAAGGGSSA
ncbi:MAG: hypothetical protein ABI232_00195, partial [Jatrophihabitantaceae bacterium]